MNRSRLVLGFTLIEVMIVLGFFALMGGLVVYNLDSLVKGYTQKTLESIFFEALKNARFQALKLQEPVYLRYDAELAEFFIENASHTCLNVYKIIADESWSPADIGVSFFLRLPGESVAHALKPKAGEVPLNHILCTPQGYTIPFQVVLRQGDFKETLWIDPFSTKKLTFF